MRDAWVDALCVLALAVGIPLVFWFLITQDIGAVIKLFGG